MSRLLVNIAIGFLLIAGVCELARGRTGAVTLDSSEIARAKEYSPNGVVSFVAFDIEVQGKNWDTSKIEIRLANVEPQRRGWMIGPGKAWAWPGKHLLQAEVDGVFIWWEDTLNIPADSLVAVSATLDTDSTGHYATFSDVDVTFRTLDKYFQLNEVSGTVYSRNPENTISGAILECLESGDRDTTNSAGEYALALDTFTNAHLRLMHEDIGTVDFSVEKLYTRTSKRVNIDLNRCLFDEVFGLIIGRMYDCRLVVSNYGWYSLFSSPHEFDETVRIFDVDVGESFDWSGKSPSKSEFRLLGLTNDTAFVRFGPDLKPQWATMEDTTSVMPISKSGTILITRTYDGGTAYELWLQQ